MKRLILLLVCLAGAAEAQPASLQGQWTITSPRDPRYLGVVLVDAEGRATWDAPLDNGRPARFRGYVSKLDTTRAELTMTNGADVAKVHCIVQASELLECRVSRGDGSVSGSFVMTRAGDGPRNLRPR